MSQNPVFLDPLKQADWRDFYDDVLRATDTQALFKLVERAEPAIRARQDVIANSANHAAERRELEEALRTVMLLKRDRLKFDSR